MGCLAHILVSFTGRNTEYIGAVSSWGGPRYSWYGVALSLLLEFETRNREALYPIPTLHIPRQGEGNVGTYSVLTEVGYWGGC